MAKGMAKDSIELVEKSARTWFLWHAAYDGEVRAAARLGEGRAPGTVIAVPANGLTAMWWVAAITAGALVPPFPISGVQRCGDPKCGLLFRRPEGRPVPHNSQREFCSERCGKRFHNRKYASGRRAAKLAGQQKKED